MLSGNSKDLKKDPRHLRLQEIAWWPRDTWPPILLVVCDMNINNSNTTTTTTTTTNNNNETTKKQKKQTTENIWQVSLTSLGICYYSFVA